MKKLILLILAFVAIATGSRASVVHNSTNFPDAAFRVVVSNLTGVSVGGTISDSQLASVTSIDVSNKKIMSLKGVEYFTELNTLTCSNNLLTSLDVSKNTKIQQFFCQNNQLTSLDVSKNTELYRFNCSDNQLTSLDVSKNTKMQFFYCSGNSLSSLDVSKNIYLTELSCNSLNLTSLNVSSLSILSSLSCYRNHLTSLVLSNNTKLRSLHCAENNLTSLVLTNNPALYHLQCYDNQIASLDLTKNTALESIFCNNNKLTTLDVTKCTLLETLCCYNNSLTTLKLSSDNTKLKTLECHANKLRSIDLSNKILLEELVCYENNLTSLYLNDCELLERLECHDNQLATLNLSKNVRLTRLNCKNNYLTHLELENNIFLTSADINPQISTRRFQTMSTNGTTNDCWALYVNTTDASRIKNFYSEMTNKPVTLLSNDPGWMVISDNLKKIPQKVSYQYNVKNSDISTEWLNVTVNYDVKNYGVFIDGTELTSLNFYDIPGLKSGTAYLMDEHEGIGWSGCLPTMVLNNAKTEGEDGIVNEGCYNFKIIANGNNVVKATDYNAFESSSAVRTTISGDTLQLIATSGTWNGVYKNDSYITITGGATLICKGEGHGFMDDGGALDINESSTLMAYGSDYPSVELPFPNDLHLGSDVQLRYPEGAYIGNNFHVYYEGTTTDVKQDWVVMGPPWAKIPPYLLAPDYDLNNDGKVSTADIQVIINEMKKPQASQNMKYDLNNDGKISTADIQVIINEMKK